MSTSTSPDLESTLAWLKSLHCQGYGTPKLRPVVASARTLGASWRRIGEQLGVGDEAARIRFRVRP